MELKNLIFFHLLTFLVIMKYSSGILLSESEQIVLESTGQLLPSTKLSLKIKEQVGAIRQLYSKQVGHIHHDASWVAGEIVVQRNELNNNIGLIKAINESKYGPLLPIVSSKNNNDDGLEGEVVLSFEKPYNSIVLSQILQNEFNVTSSKANYIIYNTRNQISFVNSAPTYYTYTFLKNWRNNSTDKVYSHFWEFTVAPSDTITVTLEKEYGDDLSLKK